MNPISPGRFSGTLVINGSVAFLVQPGGVQAIISKPNGLPPNDQQALNAAAAYLINQGLTGGQVTLNGTLVMVGNQPYICI